MVSAPEDPEGFKPIDGGWGWVVVFGAHVSIGFAYSLPKVLSIFFKGIQDDLGTSFSEIALISSVMLAAVYGGGKSNRFLLQSPACRGMGQGWGFVFQRLTLGMLSVGLSECIETIKVHLETLHNRICMHICCGVMGA